MVRSVYRRISVLLPNRLSIISMHSYALREAPGRA
jgi:hypothetical protein